MICVHCLAGEPATGECLWWGAILGLSTEPSGDCIQKAGQSYLYIDLQDSIINYRVL